MCIIDKSIKIIFSLRIAIIPKYIKNIVIVSLHKTEIGKF